MAVANGEKNVASVGLAATQWIILGLVANVCVAWGLALATLRPTYSRLWEETRSAELWPGVPTGEQEILNGDASSEWCRKSIARFEVLIPRLQDAEQITIRQINHRSNSLDVTIARCETFDHPLDPTRYTSQNAAYFYSCQAGWPFRSWSATLVIVGDPFAGTTRSIESTGDAACLVRPSAPTVAGSDLWPTRLGAPLPFSPMWIGLVLNTLTFAFILQCLAFAWVAIVERRRRRRQLCQSCRYSVAGLTKCPECGEPVDASGAAGGEEVRDATRPVDHV